MANKVEDISVSINVEDIAVSFVNVGDILVSFALGRSDNFVISSEDLAFDVEFGIKTVKLIFISEVGLTTVKLVFISIVDVGSINASTFDELETSGGISGVSSKTVLSVDPGSGFEKDEGSGKTFTSSTALESVIRGKTS